MDDVLFLDSWNPLPFLLAPPNFKALAFSDSLHRDILTCALLWRLWRKSRS